MMTRRLLSLAAGTAVIAAGLITLAAAVDDDGQIALGQLPPAVKAALEKQAHGGTIKEIEKETEHGKTVYEADVIIEGKEVEFRFDENGKLLGKETEDDDDDDDGDDDNGAKAKESERQVTAAQIPAAALTALTKLAGGAKITEFAEEVEHGHTFYEGSWKNAAGRNVDGLVTATGDLVAIEEIVGGADVPAAVMAVARKAAGQGAQMGFEKKTMTLYEIHFRKDGRSHEVLLTPDGRTVEKEVKKGGDEDEHEGQGDGESDHDDD